MGDFWTVWLHFLHNRCKVTNFHLAILGVHVLRKYSRRVRVPTAHKHPRPHTLEAVTNIIQREFVA